MGVRETFGIHFTSSRKLSKHFNWRARWVRVHLRAEWLRAGCSSRAGKGSAGSGWGCGAQGTRGGNSRPRWWVDSSPLGWPPRMTWKKREQVTVQQWFGCQDRDTLCPLGQTPVATGQREQGGNYSYFFLALEEEGG